MDWRDRMTIDPAILVGKPLIRGPRISVEFVIDLLGRGWSTEEVLQEYGHLRVEDIRGCLAYAHEMLADRRIGPAPAPGFSG